MRHHDRYLRSQVLTYSGVYAYGFERPSAIQSRAIMPVIKGEKGLDHVIAKNKF